MGITFNIKAGFSIKLQDIYKKRITKITVYKFDDINKK
jgi:hypothetical protein